MKNSLLKLLLIVICNLQFSIAFNQCPGDPGNGLFFCESISRTTLNKYLNKAAAFSYVTNPAYTDSQLDLDIQMLQRLDPRWLGRVAGDWLAGNDDVFEFSRAEYIADRIHTEVSTYIILQAAIYEYIDPKVSLYSDWNILIPSDVLALYGYPAHTGYTGYFEHDNIVYPGTNTPDMNRIEAQMWFYYRATRYIDAGYEALHLGQFMIMNDNDPLNAKWWDLLDKIRTYASTHARRKIVLIDAHVAGSGCEASGIEANDVPYTMLPGGEIPSGQLLFEYTSFGITPDEYFEPIENENNTYDGNDRLVKINYTDCAMYDKGFGGTMPVDWGWSYGQSHPIPSIAEFDLGGAPEPFLCEGMKTDDYTLCDADGDGSADDTPQWLTWGFGGESSWFGLQSPGYRRYFITYAFNRVKELDEDVYCRVNLRMPMSYSLNPWPGEIYNASNLEYGDEDVIGWLWSNQDQIDFCTKSAVSSEFTHGVTGWQGDKHIRQVVDVSGDGKDDLVGFGESNLIVQTSNGSGFNSPTIWYNNDFTYAFGWSVTNHVRRIADINGDGKLDVIGFDNNGVKVAKSNGSSFNTAYYASVLFGNLDGWNPTKHVRDIGDFTGDGLIDIIGCWENETKVRKSNGSNFITTAPHSDVWSTEFCYSNGWRLEKHLRLIGDVNGDGKDDIVGFKDDDVYVGISTGTSFVTSIWYEDNFCFNQGWDNNNDYRILADVNGDGKDDIVGFGYWGVQVALSTGTNFSQAEIWIYDFGLDAAVGGWNTALHTRTCADINGDGKSDIVGFGNTGTIVSLSTGKSFSKIGTYIDFNYPVYTNSNNPRILADMDADGRSEIIAYGESQVYLLNCNLGSETFRLSDSNEQENNNNFKIYPNPSSGIINIEFENPVMGELIISDIQGRRIYNETFEMACQFKSILLNNQTVNGIYFISFITTDQVVHSKKLFLLH
ncbi:MAG TPA: T9SS type A sorting domain-containing protein [Chitinophagales bacterium]|nr:T9SS type A sorting domain-containing protein [Chitinophagales bacterium]